MVDNTSAISHFQTRTLRRDPPGRRVLDGGSLSSMETECCGRTFAYIRMVKALC